MIETEVYKIGAGRYGRRVAQRLASRWWWALAAPLFSVIIAGSWDWRWWIVGLAMVLVLYPGVLMMAYYYYALSAEAVRSILPQKAIITPEGVTLIYYPMAEDCNAPKPREIPRGEIRQVVIAGDYVDLQLDKDEIVEIPRSAFARGDIYKAFPELR